MRGYLSSAFFSVFLMSIAMLTLLSVPGPSSSEERIEHKASEVLQIEIAEGIKMKFCWIPAGTATLGSPAMEKDRYYDEGEQPFTTKGFFEPDGFWLGKYTVTQEQWAAIMKKNPSWFSKGGGGKKLVEGMDTSRFPVEQVSWNDCQEFLKKLNEKIALPSSLGRRKFALPHEREWEYACRGGKGNKSPFYFGEELNGASANCNGKLPFGATATEGAYLRRTAEVGSYEQAAPHPWGLCDMGGNVWQWCDNKYEQHESHRALRGGCWYDRAAACRSASRSSGAPDIRFVGGGLRIALLFP